MLQPTMAQLHIEKIESNTGYTIVQETQILIPKTYNYSLHIIELDQIDKLIKGLKTSASLLPEVLSYSLIRDIDKLQYKLLTLGYEHQTKQKRGLINFLGKINKWIAGTMDDEDRQMINQHLEIIDTNNHNLITNMNKQIQINENFNTSLNKLFNVIQNDRQIIQDFLKMETDKTRLRIAIFDIKINIQEVDKMISELQDNIIFSNLNVIHPSLLTHEEILNYEINADKIKNLKVGYSKTTTNKLLFLIKIPYRMTLINKKVIIPLSNVHTCNVIDYPITQTLEYRGEYYEYDENKAIHQLNNLKHCIIKKNCKNIKNCNTEVYNIDDSSILIQLANNLTLTSNCDERKFELYGNYFVKFYNCTINVDNRTYYNNIINIKNKYTIPNLSYKSENNILTFSEIILETKRNIEEIQELKHHKILVYSGISLTTIVVLAIVIIIIYIYCKQRKLKIKIVNRIQENPTLNEGRVTFQPNSGKEEENVYFGSPNVETLADPHKQILF